jgi:cytoskeletal protein CcmA (bactofilin family)
MGFMRKTLVSSALFFLLLPLSLSASTFELGQDYFLSRDDSIDGDLYVASVNSTIAGLVSGDLLVAGNVIFLGDEVSEDAFLVGRKVSSFGNVGGDLRIMAESAHLKGDVGRSLVSVSGELIILPETSISGDVYFAGGKFSLEGSLKGDLKIAAGEVFINGEISGDTEIAADKLSLGPNAVLQSLTYSSAEEALIDEAARIEGTIDFREIASRPRAEKFIPTFWNTLSLVKFIMLLIGALVLHGIFRRVSERFVSNGIEHFWKSLLWGFLFLVAVPVAMVLVALTFVGIPFVLIGVSIYLLLIILAFFYGPVLLGSLIYRFVKKEKEFRVTWKTILLGVALASILDYVKYGGAGIRFVFLLSALGSIIIVIAHKFREVR